MTQGISKKLTENNPYNCSVVSFYNMAGSIIVFLFQTDRSEHTKQTQIRLLLQGLSCLQFVLQFLVALL